MPVAERYAIHAESDELPAVMAAVKNGRLVGYVRAIQHDLIRTHPLGLLITAGPSGLLANSIPFLIDSEESARGTLRCHLARANPQWRELAQGGEALVVFQGAGSYITPSWYATKRDTGKVVPTWNYLMAQARGIPRVVESADWLRAHARIPTVDKFTVAVLHVCPELFVVIAELGYELLSVIRHGQIGMCSSKQQYVTFDLS